MHSVTESFSNNDLSRDQGIRTLRDRTTQTSQMHSTATTLAAYPRPEVPKPQRRSTDGHPSVPERIKRNNSHDELHPCNSHSKIKRRRSSRL
jgi:hypothetical protein